MAARVCASMCEHRHVSLCVRDSLRQWGDDEVRNMVGLGGERGVKLERESEKDEERRERLQLNPIRKSIYVCILGSKTCLNPSKALFTALCSHLFLSLFCRLSLSIPPPSV